MNESTKRTVTIFTIAFSLLPCLLILHFPATATVSSVALWASAAIGYMGIVLLLWMYILGTKGVMSYIYSDLAPVLSIHKWLGKYGSIAVFLHPILITISYGETWLYSIIPKVGTVAERHILLGQIALCLLALTWGISFFMRKKLAYRPWKYTHYLAYICVPFALLHVPDLGSQEQTYLVVKGYLFILALVYFIFVLLRLRSWMNLDKTTYTVLRHVQLTDVDFMMRLIPTSGHLITPKRGQYVYLKLGLLSEDHPFSVTQYDQKTGYITLAYRLAGMFTKELRKLSEGNHVSVSGPFGSFMEDLSSTDTTPVVYLAGGIGITPFVERIMNESDSREQWLFAAHRTRELAVLYEPLKSKLGNRAVAVFNSDDSDLGPHEERGYITADIIKKYIDDPTRYRYYLCGPPLMMDAMRAMVTSLGVAPEQVKYEKFGW